ncbi:MAG: hypothetical protein WAL63_16075, partial [Solirubrobacteraceae bacterium]
MSGVSRLKVLWPVLAAAAAAEGGRRLLAPSAPAPIRADLGAYFTTAEINRGRRFARPQLGLGLAGGALDLGALALLALRPPPILRRSAGRPALS